jgi:hypothetical protein
MMLPRVTLTSDPPFSDVGMLSHEGTRINPSHGKTRKTSGFSNKYVKKTLVSPVSLV